MAALLLGGLPLLACSSPASTTGPPSCSSWTAGSCLSWKDGKLAMFTNLWTPASCCAQCGADARCRAWSLYGGGGKEQNRTYCDLYASDKPVRNRCANGVSSNPSGGGPPPPTPPQPVVPPPPKPKPGAPQFDVLMFVVDDMRYQFGFEGPGVAGPGCAAPARATNRSSSFFPPCGGMSTPSLDALVAEPGSTLFGRHYVQQAVCAATRASVLTSRRPDATRWGNGYFRETAGNWSTLPETFRRSVISGRTFCVASVVRRLADS